MEQAKVGRFIAKCRKNKNMTQADLAEKLNITDRAISKWENYNQKAEENLLEMKKQKEETDREMLRIEIVIGYISSITFLILVFIASFVQIYPVIRILLIIGGSIVFSIGVINAIKIVQTAGYYECDKCHYKYIPTYKSVLFAMHYGRTRYMKCPKCNEKSWNKKVLTK